MTPIRRHVWHTLSMCSAIDVLSYSPTPDNPLKLVLLLVALVSLQPSPSLSARHPVTFPSATDIFLDRPLVLTPRYDYVVNLRREPGQKAGQRATLKVIVRAPNNRKAMAAAEALHPAYQAVDAIRRHALGELSSSP